MTKNKTLAVKGVPQSIRNKINTLMRDAANASWAGSAHPDDYDIIINQEKISKQKLEIAISKAIAKAKTNQFYAEGANGGCYFRIEELKNKLIHMDVGWSCVVVHDDSIPISWLSELIAIATSHEGGIGGFLASYQYSGSSYALMCDPIKEKSND